MAEKKQSRAGINPNHFTKINQLKKKRKEASEKPRKNLKKRSVTTGTGRHFSFLNFFLVFQNLL